MIKYTFIMLLIVHVLCDFYFQSSKMAELKKRKISGVFIHSTIYAVSAVIILKLSMPGLYWKYLLSFIAVHALIDIAKYMLCHCRYTKRVLFLKKERNILIADQFLHISAILAIAYMARNIEMSHLYNMQLKGFLDTIGIPETIAMCWIIKILLIHKPANILVAAILSPYRPEEHGNKKTTDKNAGRLIGTLERIIMTIFMSINQYSAVGLVLTAKSITRYDRISKDQEFAEYYLLGTLSSTICAIVVSIAFSA